MNTENKIINLPQTVTNNLRALQAEKMRIDDAIQLVLSTAVAMSGVTDNRQFGLSDDCTQLIEVGAE